MPFQLHCPTCNRLLHVPEHLAGNRLRCPGCHSTVEAIVPATLATPASQATAPAVPFPDTDDAFNVFRRPARSEFDWRGFDIGLLVSLFATIVVGVVVILVAILELVDTPGLDSVYYQILHHALLLGLIVLAISFFISSSIPAMVGERPMILASFMFMAGGVSLAGSVLFLF